MHSFLSKLKSKRHRKSSENGSISEASETSSVGTEDVSYVPSARYEYHGADYETVKPSENNVGATEAHITKPSSTTPLKDVASIDKGKGKGIVDHGLRPILSNPSSPRKDRHNLHVHFSELSLSGPYREEQDLDDRPESPTTQPSGHNQPLVPSSPRISKRLLMNDEEYEEHRERRAEKNTTESWQKRRPEWFPQPGDSPDAIEDKERLRSGMDATDLRVVKARQTVTAGNAYAMFHRAANQVKTMDFAVDPAMKKRAED